MCTTARRLSISSTPARGTSKKLLEPLGSRPDNTANQKGSDQIGQSPFSFCPHGRAVARAQPQASAPAQGPPRRAGGAPSRIAQRFERRGEARSASGGRPLMRSGGVLLQLFHDEFFVRG